MAAPRKQYSDREFTFIKKEEFDELIDELGYIRLQEMEGTRRKNAEKLRKLYSSKEFPAVTEEEWNQEIDKGMKKAALIQLHEARKAIVDKKLKDRCMTTKFSSPNPKPKELRIAMVGKTGDGKSSIANAILGREAFKSDSAAKSVTTVSTLNEGTWNGIKVRVVDTPGLQDTHRPKEEILREVARIIQLFPEGIHCFLYVINLARHRFTKEDREVLTDITELFGVDFTKYVILVYSHADVEKDLNIVEFKGKIIRGDPKGAQAEFLTELGERIVAIETKTRTKYDEIGNQKMMLRYVLDTFKKNGDTYTNRLFKSVHGLINGKVESKVATIVRAYYHQHPEVLECENVSHELLEHVKSKVDKDYVLSDPQWCGEILTAISALKTELLHVYQDLDKILGSKLCQIV